jgi:polyisoprenoid-binding protein YceI
MSTTDPASTAATAPVPPGYSVGTWVIDPVHSEAAFTVKHLGISKVRGRFHELEGRIVTAENPLESTVSATILTTSVSTGNGQRDAHIQAEDFLHSEEFPEITFASTAVRPSEDGFAVEGELTIRGVTRPVTLDLEIEGFGTGMDGKPAAGFSATTKIKRNDFGVTGGAAGVAVSDAITITLDIEANQE